MAEPSPPPIQQPQPSLPQPAFVPGGQMVPGQPPPPIPGQGPMDTTPTAPAIDGQTPVVVAVEENPCETLYIQNLNEKVKPQGTRYLCLMHRISMLIGLQCCKRR